MKFCPKCGQIIGSPGSQLGRLSANKRFNGKSEKEKSEIMKELVKKRWSKPR